MLPEISSIWLGGIALMSAAALGLALGKLLGPVSKQPAKAPQDVAIDLLMAGPVASYSFPEQPSEDDVSDKDMTPQSETDILIKQARMEEKVDGLSRTMEREFARMAEAIGKHADAVNAAFAAMKNDFVSKSDFAALLEKQAKVERIVYGACGIILVAVLGALVALVVVRP